MSTSNYISTLCTFIRNDPSCRFDYLARDTIAIGDRGNLSLSHLIHSARVIDNQICWDIEDANQLYELCNTRFSLHKRIYNHQTSENHLSSIRWICVNWMVTLHSESNRIHDHRRTYIGRAIFENCRSDTGPKQISLPYRPHHVPDRNERYPCTMPIQSN